MRAATDTKSVGPEVNVIRSESIEQKFDQRWTGGFEGGEGQTLDPVLVAPTEVLIGDDRKSGKFDAKIKQEIRDVRGFDPAMNPGSGKEIKLDLPPVPALIDDRIIRDSIKLQPQLNEEIFNNNDLSKSGRGKLLK